MSKAALLFCVGLILACATEYSDGAGCEVGGKKYDAGAHWHTTGNDATMPCAHMTCKAGGEISAIRCGAVQVPDDCEMVPGPVNAAHPDCCPQLKCK